MTTREQILQALGTKLDAVGGATFYRSRQAALSKNEVPAIVLQPEEEEVEFLSPMQAKRTLMIIVTVLVRDLVGDTAADPIIEAVHATIMSDPTLGNTVGRIIEQGTRWQYEQADQNALAVEIRYQIRYTTPAQLA